MASKSRSGKFAVVLAAVVLTVTGFAAMAYGTGYIVGQYPIALDVVTPKDQSAFKTGESVTVTVKSSGFTGVKVVAKEAATGREEELRAALVKSEGSGSLAPKMWNAPWSTAGKTPGTYTFTVTGLGGAKAAPVAKSVTVSIIQPSGPAKITFQEPAGGRQVKPGETVSVAVKASGVDKVEFRVKDLQTGAERGRPNAHVQGTEDYTTSWSAEESAKGNYRIIARGLGTDGKKLAEESVTVSVVEPGAPAHIKITTPSEGAQFQLGSSVAIAAQASGVTTLRFLAKHLQTGTTFFIPDLPKQNMAFWNTNGLRQGTYQILAVGFDAGGRKNAEASVIITITGDRK